MRIKGAARKKPGVYGEEASEEMEAATCSLEDRGGGTIKNQTEEDEDGDECHDQPKQGFCDLEEATVWLSKPYALEVTVVGASGLDAEHDAVNSFWEYYVVTWVHPGVVRCTNLSVGDNLRWSGDVFLFPVDDPGGVQEDRCHVFFQVVRRKGCLDADVGTSNGEQVVGRARVKMPATVREPETSQTLDLKRPAGGVDGVMFEAAGKLFVRMRFTAGMGALGLGLGLVGPPPPLRGR